MKTFIQKTFNFAALALGCALTFTANNVRAVLTTWDPQGTTGGTATGPTTGGYTGNMSQTWENALWSTSQTGQATPQTFVENTAAFFACQANDNTPAFTVTMNANHSVAGIFDGPLSAYPCTVTIVGTGIITVSGAAGALQGFDVTSDTGDPGNLIISNTLAGVAVVTPQGSGQIYLNGSNTYSGGTSLGYSMNTFVGIINFNNSSSFGTGTIIVSNTTTSICALVAEGSSPITIPNAFNVGTATGGINLVSGSAPSVTFTGNWALPQTANIGAGTAANVAVLSGVMSGAGGVTKFNPGTLRLSGANTYTGNTTVTNGTLQLGANGGIPSKSSVTLTSSTGINAILDVNGFSGAVNGLAGNGIVDNTSATAGTLSIGNNNASTTFSGTLRNTGAGGLGITKVGTGTFTYSATNTSYTGNTTVSAGTLAIGTGVGIPAASAVIVNTGATLNLAGNATTLAALSDGGSVTNNSGGLTLGGNSSSSNYAAYSCFFGSIDQGTFIKAGSHTMSLRQTNMYNPNVNFSFQGGVLSVGAAPNELPPTFALNVPSGGLFQLDANSQTISSLNGTGNINLGGGTLTINATAGGFYSGTIQNSELPGSSTAAGHGLRGYYYNNIDFSDLVTVRDDATVNFPDLTSATYLPSPPYPKTNYISIRWLGQVQTTVAGTYTFTVTSDDGQRLWVNGTNLVDDWASQGATAKSGSITLAANTRYDIVMEYMNISGGASTKLAWTPPGDVTSTVIPTDYLFLPGPGNLAVTGSSDVTLAGVSTYSGGTTVSSTGTLEASGDNTLGLGNVYVNSGGSLTLDSGVTNGYISPTGDLVINPTSSVYLNYTGTNTIHGFSTNGGTTYLPVGTYGASGSGAANTTLSQFNPAGTGVLNVTAVPAIINLTSSSGTSVYGSSVTFTSTVTGSGPTPTGTVTLYDGASAIGMMTLSGGQAIFSISDLQAITSPHSVTAVYSGDSVYIQASSSALSQIVQPLGVSATGFSAASRVYNATNNVTVSGGALVGVLTNDTNNVRIGSSTASFSDKNVGTNKTVTITNIVLAGSLAGDYTVSPGSTTTTANITNAVLTVANVTAVNEVYNGSTAIGLNTGTAALVGVFAGDNVTLNTGSAAGSVATATVGANKAVTVTGLTTGGTDAGNYALTQPATTVTISQASTTNVLISSSNPSAVGANVTFTSTPTPIAPGAGVPTGSVVFLTNGVTFSTIALSSGSALSGGTTSLPSGTNIITAQYAGDANFIGSTNTLSQVVGSAPPPGPLSISLTGGHVVLNWSGSFTLQSAPGVNGTNSGFADLPGPVLTAPYTNTNTAAETFFRLRN